MQQVLSYMIHHHIWHQNKVLKNTDPITLHLTVKLGAAHVQLAIFYKRLVVATNTIDFYCFVRNDLQYAHLLAHLLRN